VSPFIDPAQLRAGDVLLMKGIGAVSDLVAWFGDSIYSHAAIMVDAEYFVEAAPPVSRRVRLADRLKQVQHYDFVTAMRPTRASGQPLDRVERAAVAEASLAYVDVKYPLDSLVQMALAAALRNRVPANAGLRWLLRQVLDRLHDFDPTQLVCSELVYAALREAKLAPALIISAQLDQPLPKVDVGELIRAWLELRGKRAGTIELTQGEALELDEASLMESFEQVRQQRLDAPAKAARERALGMPPVLNPNPRNVLPVDLETSPQLRLLGRLPLQA